MAKKKASKPKKEKSNMGKAMGAANKRAAARRRGILTKSDEKNNQRSGS